MLTMQALICVNLSGIVNKKAEYGFIWGDLEYEECRSTVSLI